jgi:hypothetical protein
MPPLATLTHSACEAVSQAHLREVSLREALQDMHDALSRTASDRQRSKELVAELQVLILMFHDPWIALRMLSLQILALQMLALQMLTELLLLSIHAATTTDNWCAWMIAQISCIRPCSLLRKYQAGVGVNVALF